MEGAQQSFHPFFPGVTGELLLLCTSMHWYSSYWIAGILKTARNIYALATAGVLILLTHQASMLCQSKNLSIIRLKIYVCEINNQLLGSYYLRRNLNQSNLFISDLYCDIDNSVPFSLSVNERVLSFLNILSSTQQEF